MKHLKDEWEIRRPAKSASFSLNCQHVNLSEKHVYIVLGVHLHSSLGNSDRFVNISSIYQT